MNHKFAYVALLTAALAGAPVFSAQAQEHYRHHGSNGGDLALGLFAAGVTGAALALATAPQTVVMAPPPPPPAPIYVQPAPAYYGYAYPPAYVRPIDYPPPYVTYVVHPRHHAYRHF